MAGRARAGRIKIDIVAGVADFNSDVDKATRKLGELGTHGVSGVQAVSGALRVLEGNLTNNLRAAENFIAKTLGLGEVLKAAFPVVGAIALGGVLSELVKRAGEAYEGFVKLQEAPKRISQSFQDITAPLRVANDQLAVTNDRLENQIAKLEGRRQNSLKLMLDEARLSADTLAEASNRDLKEVQKLLETEQIGAFKGFFTNIASTTGLTDQFKKFRDQMNDLNIQTADKIAGTSDKKQQTDIYEDATNRRKALIDSETARLREQLGVVEKLQAERDNPNPGRVIGVTAGVPIFERGKPTGPNQAANIATLKEEIANLQSLSANISLTQTSAALNARKNALDTAKQNAGLQKPYDDRVSSMAAALEAAQARAKAPDVNTFAGALAAGFAEATKAIEETNKALAEHHQHLTLDQRLTLTSLATQTALTELSGRAAQKQKDLQKELEAGAQTVAVHMQLEVEALNARLEQLQARIDEIRAATKEANVGPAAAFQARYSTMPSETPEDQKKKELALAEYQNRVAVTTAELQRQTAATIELTKAQNMGLEAQRQAVLANIRKSGLDSAEVKARVDAQKAQWQLEDAQTMRHASAADGARRFFNEMVDNARSAGQQVHEALTSAFEGVNDQLSRMMTGQKTDWASFLQGFGQQLSKMSLQNAEAGSPSSLSRVEKVAACGTRRHPTELEELVVCSGNWAACSEDRLAVTEVRKQVRSSFK